MSDGTFDRRVVYTREKATSNDWDLSESQLDQALRDVLLKLLSTRATNATHLPGFVGGFLAESFLVSPTAILSSNVQLLSGVGFQQSLIDTPSGIGNAGVNDISQLKPLVLKEPQTIIIQAPPAFPNNRIDIVEVRYDRALVDPEVIRILDPVSATYIPTPNVLKTLTFALDGKVGTVATPNPSTTPIGVVTGTPGNPPVVPPTTAGYIKIAEVFVENLTANPTGLIDFKYLRDYRPLVFANARAPYQVDFQTVPGAANPPQNVKIDCPPGIRVAVSTTDPVTGLGYTDGSADIYFICAAGSATYSWVYETLTAGTYDIRTNLLTGVLTAQEKVAVEAANAYPGSGLGFLAAEGAPRIRLTLVPYDGGAVPGATVQMRVSGSLGER